MPRSRSSFHRPAPASPRPPGSAESPEPPPPDWSGAAPAREESITDAAERILFASNLEEKLRLFSPEASFGEAGGAPRIPPDRLEPGRPRELRFADLSLIKAPLPSVPALIDEENRGRLLHFFANHELLAAELMALALLRFPEAPAAFREGLARTLVEELKHTRWYLARMEACGVAFGQYPVSGFFWDAVSSMAEPIDYVSRLSLTFEQANLDYARHYAELFETVGDRRSAAILGRIYRDEISHVGYGLHWFRHWKEPGLSDWDALERRLAFPLSPSRAKGNRTEFNGEGRRAAGFGDDYIDRLELFERSKGRSPNVFYFNPEAEARIGASPLPYTPSRGGEALARDLELLCAFLARRDDVVLMRRPPSAGHRRRLLEHGFALPEIEALGPELSLTPASLLRERKIRRFVPWAKAPDLGRRFGVLAERCADAEGLRWSPPLRELFSKIEQREALAPWFGPSIPVRRAEDLAEAVASLAGDAPDSISSPAASLLLKRPYSAAGGGLLRLFPAELLALAARSFSKRSRREGGFLLEPWHERVFDFSVQYQIEKGGARFLGFVEQRLSPAGRYRGSLAMPRFCQGLPPELARCLATEALPLYDPEGGLAQAILRWTRQVGYEGPLGVDAYLHREAGLLKHRPVCEINPRYTMGRVALELRRLVASGHGLLLETVPATSSDEAGAEPVLERGRLCGGSLRLTEPAADATFAARVTAAKHRSALNSPGGSSTQLRARK